MRKELEDRLINFAVLVLNIIESLPKSHCNNVISVQLAKSSTSSALNYGEALGAESKKDFIHKNSIILKELRETLIGLKILRKKNQERTILNLDLAIKENNELISIFVKSIQTASRNLSKNIYSI